MVSAVRFIGADRASVSGVESERNGGSMVVTGDGGEWFPVSHVDRTYDRE